MPYTNSAGADQIAVCSVPILFAIPLNIFKKQVRIKLVENLGCLRYVVRNFRMFILIHIFFLFLHEVRSTHNMFSWRSKKHVTIFQMKKCLICIRRSTILGPDELEHVQSDQGPVVQSVVSLTSSLRVISLTILADSIHNILIFFAEKMWVAFAKATHIFSAKNIRIFVYHSM